MPIEFDEFIKKDRAIDLLLELSKGPNHVRALIRKVGGGSQTVLDRINELVDMGIAVDHHESNKRIIRLRDIGYYYARILGYFLKPGRPREREKWILALIWAMGDNKESKRIWTKIRLQKLLFLLKHDKDFLVKFLPYNFYPWKQGPFDDTIIEDVRNLELKLLIRIKPIQTNKSRKGSEMYELTPRGADVARRAFYSFPAKIRMKMIQLRQFNKMNRNDLIKYVYSKFPEYKSKADPKFIKTIKLNNNHDKELEFS